MIAFPCASTDLPLQDFSTLLFLFPSPSPPLSSLVPIGRNETGGRSETITRTAVRDGLKSIVSRCDRNERTPPIGKNQERRSDMIRVRVYAFPWQRSRSEIETGRTGERRTIQIMYSIQVIYSVPDTIFMSPPVFCHQSIIHSVAVNKHFRLPIVSFASFLFHPSESLYSQSPRISATNFLRCSHRNTLVITRVVAIEFELEFKIQRGKRSKSTIVRMK